MMLTEKITFAPIAYSTLDKDYTDTHYYILQETKGSEDGMFYDATVYKYKVVLQKMKIRINWIQLIRI